MTRHKVHTTGDVPPDTEIERRVLDEIRALPALSVADLKKKWHDLSGQEPPQFAKRSLLTQLVAWDLQAAAFGGLKPSLHRLLLDIGSRRQADGGTSSKSPTTELRPGVKLIRVWKGVTHHVTVTDGGFVWQDRNCKSLSMIAREITGTPWSGPVFFGLKKSGTNRPPECPSPAVAAPAATRIPARVSTEEPAHG